MILVQGNNTTHLVTNTKPFNGANELQEPPALLVKALQFYFKSIGRLFPRISVKLASQLFSSPFYRAKHRRSDELLESAERSFLKVDGNNIRIYKWGSSDRKVLLLHGWQSRGTALRGFVPGLIEKGFEVIALDAPAHGESDGKACSVRLYAEAVEAVVAKYPEISSVISHSIGSVTWMYYSSFINPAFKLERLIMMAAPDSFENIVNNAIRMFGLSGKLKNLFMEEVFDHFNITDAEDFSLSGKLGQVNINEVYVIHDEEDRLIPMRRATYIIEHISQSHLYITKGFGHFRLVKNPVVMQKVLDLVK